MIKNLFLIIFFVLGCSTKPKSLPIWVVKTENNSIEWIGIGSSKLSREVAIKSAINSIASQITVHIKSNIQSKISEHNSQFNQYSKSIIESRVDISLPEIEINEVIKIEETWYARATLNKENYYTKLEKKRENAVKNATFLLNKSKNLNVLSSLQALFRAYQEIVEFLDVPINIVINNKSVNLYTEIIKEFNDVIQNIKIKPEKSNYALKSIIPLNKIIPVKIISNNDMSTEGLPFLVKSNSGGINTSLFVDNDLLNIFIKNINSSKLIDNLSIKLDISSILNIKNVPIQFDIIHSNNIIFDIIPAKFYVESSEYNLGEKLEIKVIYPIITQYIINDFGGIISNNRDESDIVLNIDSRTKRGNDGKNEWGVYKTFVDFKIDLISSYNNHMFFNFSNNKIYGGDFVSHKNAGSQAFNNLATELKEEILPIMYKSLVQN